MKQLGTATTLYAFCINLTQGYVLPASREPTIDFLAPFAPHVSCSDWDAARRIVRELLRDYNHSKLFSVFDLISIK